MCTRCGALFKAGWFKGPALVPFAELEGEGPGTLPFWFRRRGAQVPEVILKGGVGLRFFTDHLRSPRLFVHAETGEAVQRLDFEGGARSWPTRTRVPSLPFRRRFLGPRHQVLHLGAREYDPATGRFLQRDPLLFGGGDTNLYAYAAGDPVNLIDPTGTSAEGLLDRLGLGLDLAGMLPVVGEAADLASAGLAMVRGDCASAAMSLAAMVPFAGAAATVGKWGRRGRSAIHAAGGAPKLLTPGLRAAEGQLGRKIGKHARSFGLDPGNVLHRAQLRQRVQDIVGRYSEFRQGPWRGGKRNYLFYREGADVVITKPNGDFVTILSNGMNNEFFQRAAVLFR